MTRRTLIIDLASPRPAAPRLLPTLMIPIGPGRATVSLDGSSVEQVLAELLAAGIQVKRCRVVDDPG